VSFNAYPLHQLRVGDVVKTEGQNVYSVTHVGPLRAALKPISGSKPGFASRMKLVQSAELARALALYSNAERRLKTVGDVELALSNLRDAARWVELAKVRADDDEDELAYTAETLAHMEEALTAKETS